MTIRSALAGATLALGLLVAAGCGAADSAGDPAVGAAPTVEAAQQKGDLNCNQTEDEFHEKGYVYLYRDENCKGPQDARDDSKGDKDYDDGEEQIKDFDNRTDSIINTTTSHVEFYNYPNFNKGAGDKGDSFCVGPGEWVTRLQFYGDADGGTEKWWKNSISSHRKVKEADCGRWFGWGTER